MSTTGADSIGGRIRQLRTEQGMSLPELAEQAGISKSYIWNLENKPEHQRPSAETLYALAKALGTTMAALLGRQVLNEPTVEIEPSLAAYAKQAHLPEADVMMLASIRFRGGPPKTVERWAFIHSALKASRSLDE